MVRDEVQIAEVDVIIDVVVRERDCVARRIAQPHIAPAGLIAHPAKRPPSGEAVTSTANGALICSMLKVCACAPVAMNAPRTNVAMRSMDCTKVREPSFGPSPVRSPLGEYRSNRPGSIQFRRFAVLRVVAPRDVPQLCAFHSPNQLAHVLADTAVAAARNLSVDKFFESSGSEIFMLS
jgi:hypothetical protein